MSTTTHTPRALLKQAWALSPALTLATGVMVLGALCTTLGLLFDSRQLMGEPLWLKPTKFYIALAVYNAALLSLFSFLPERRGFTRVVGSVLAVCGALEMVAITVQAARGVRSHFNIATPLDAFLFASMGVTIVVLWAATMALAVVLLRTRLERRPLASALRMGLVVAVVGMGTGFFMTSPHGEQLEEMQSGQRPLEAGSHSFGGKDGGPGLPLVGWSTTAGDMRPAHFLGLHAMQVLPVLAALLARRRVRSEAHELAVVRSVGVAWLGLTLVLAIQALRGVPVVQWDGVGLVGLSLVAGMSLFTFVASATRGRALASAAV